MAVHVFSNLATSLDGKIATTSRELVHLGTPADRVHMQFLRKRADIVLMGASTLRTFRRFCGIRGAQPSHQIANAVLSTSLEGVEPDFPFFANPAWRRIIFVTRSLPPARRKPFERSSEVVLLSRKDIPVAIQIIEALEARGIRRLLIEGGGGLMWDFASLNLIDEYHVTLTPKIVGGRDSPTLVEGGGFDPRRILSLKLARCHRLGDELYLTYRTVRPKSSGQHSATAHCYTGSPGKRQRHRK